MSASQAQSGTTLPRLHFALASLGALLRSRAVVATLLVAAIAGCGTETVVGTGGGGGGACRREVRGDEVHLEAFIEAVPADRTITVCRYTVLITDATEIRGHGHDPIRPSDLLVGMFVEVEGIASAPDTVLAVRIDVETHDDSRASHPGAGR